MPAQPAKPATHLELMNLTKLYGYQIAFIGPSRVFISQPGVAGSILRGRTDWTIEKWIEKIKQ